MSLLRSFKTLSHLLCLACFATGSAFATGISAAATYTSQSDVSRPGIFDYSLTLQNTGDTTIGTFWFAWIPRGDFLSPVPTNVGSPAGWAAQVLTAAQGTSLRWTTASDLLLPGDSLSGFTFSSTETPEQLLGLVPSGVGAGLPLTTSFAYIGAPLADPGTQFVATASTPEPSSLLLLATGLTGIGVVLQSKRKQDQSWG